MVQVLTPEAPEQEGASLADLLSRGEARERETDEDWRRRYGGG
jgi:hypothetical protein